MTKIESPMWLIVSIIENRFGFKQANLTVELADISVFFFSLIALSNKSRQFVVLG